MLSGLLIALVVIAALSCPVMMLLGRRGIGPGCALMGCQPRRDQDSLESLRARQRDLAARIDEFGEVEQTPTPVARTATEAAASGER
jgi:hypothetical protein